jgi:hypothetical protein
MWPGRCPPIEELEALAERDNKKVMKHAERCVACQGVLAIIADRSADIETPECAEIELLAATGGDSDIEKIRRHTSTCESCRVLWSGSLP